VDSICSMASPCRSTMAELWRCPGCGRRFANRNQAHSCLTMTIEEHLADATPAAAELNDTIVAALQECGEFRVHPQRTRVAFTSRMSFAGVTIARAISPSSRRVRSPTPESGASCSTDRRASTTRCDCAPSTRSTPTSDAGCASLTVGAAGDARSVGGGRSGDRDHPGASSGAVRFNGRSGRRGSPPHRPALCRRGIRRSSACRRQGDRSGAVIESGERGVVRIDPAALGLGEGDEVDVTSGPISRPRRVPLRSGRPCATALPGSGRVPSRSDPNPE
jgi:hypothetical protein